MLNRQKNRRIVRTIFVISTVTFILLSGRLCYLMIFQSEYYSNQALDLHERERKIKAQRGLIVDRNGTVLADNRTVCTVSVIHSQITNPEGVIGMLSRELSMSEESVRKRVEKYSSIERIKSNVDKVLGDKIRAYDFDGVKVDEDYKRFYPYEEIASKVLGFTGADNQGIIGLEVKYEEQLKGKEGVILAVTDARGVELEEYGERRKEPTDGNTLRLSLDLNIQMYATQLAKQVMETKQADAVSIIVMNPVNGEIYCMVDVPEFNLNHPYELDWNQTEFNDKEKQNQLNKMWRNSCINDTYEPGSTFKIITAAAGLEEGVVHVDDTFSCPGFIMVEDRKIRCHKTTGHGSETFLQGTMNSCNPVFVTVGLRLGVDNYVRYFEQFGLRKKTGIDLPGEAATIMHKKENIKAVELATVSFGQSFQITPIQLITTVSALINDGKRVTPHFGVSSMEKFNQTEEYFEYPVSDSVVTSETSETLRMILEQVVENGTGKNGYVEGFHIGGKTATSQTLPRGSGRYIASFIGFAPADNPEVIALAVIHNPKGIYYGGQIAAPVVRQLFENIIPYIEEREESSF